MSIRDYSPHIEYEKNKNKELEEELEEELKELKEQIREDLIKSTLGLFGFMLFAFFSCALVQGGKSKVAEKDNVKTENIDSLRNNLLQKNNSVAK